MARLDQSGVGVVPSGAKLNPWLNATQSLVAQFWGGGWRVRLYHSTPAALQGRPDHAEALMSDLNRRLAGNYALARRLVSAEDSVIRGGEP